MKLPFSADHAMNVLGWWPSREQIGWGMLGATGVLLADRKWVQAGIMVALAIVALLSVKVRRRRRERSA